MEGGAALNRRTKEHSYVEQERKSELFGAAGGLRRSSWTPLFYSRGDTGREVYPSGACQRNLVTKWFSVEVQYGISYWVVHKYHVYEETVSLTTGAKVIVASCKWTFPGGRPRSSPRSMRTTEGPVNDHDGDSLEVFAGSPRRRRGVASPWRIRTGLLGKWLPFLPDEFTIHECVTPGR